MAALELACLGIVVLYVGVKLRRGAESPGAMLGRLAVVGVAAWVTEETCIRLYGFYTYDPGWTIFVGHVPLLVALIWPVVIDSARELAVGGALAPTLLPQTPLAHKGLPQRAATVTAALVLTDAALIEPVAVHAGLWTWTEPGLFGVPPAGVLGWALFTFACVGILDAIESRGRGLSWTLIAIPGALVTTHVLLLAAWWGALRWLSVELSPWPAVVFAWVMSAILTAAALRVGPERIHPLRILLQRVPAAMFFFALLWIYREGSGALIPWVCAFAPPYLVLTTRAWCAARD